MLICYSPTHTHTDLYPNENTNMIFLTNLFFFFVTSVNVRAEILESETGNKDHSMMLLLLGKYSTSSSESD